MEKYRNTGMNQHSSLMFCVNNAQCHSRVGATACADYQLITPPHIILFNELFLAKAARIIAGISELSVMPFAVCRCDFQ